MTITDCFRILGIPRNACLNDLKIAYRSKAKKYHPDRNGGDGRQFTRLHEAYTFLLDSGSFHVGAVNPSNVHYRREAEEKLRREAFREAQQKRAREEALKRAAREKARQEAEERAAFEMKRKEMEKRAAERKALYE